MYGDYDPERRAQELAQMQTVLRPPAVEKMQERAHNGANLWTGIAVALVARDLYRWNQRRQPEVYGYYEEPETVVTEARVIREEQPALGQAPGQDKFWLNMAVIVVSLIVIIVLATN